MMKSPFARHDPATLVAAWRTAHSQRTSDDWHTTGVDKLAEAIAYRRDAVQPARLLGRQRAGAGVGIRESLQDLETPYRLYAHGEPPHAVSRAFAEGWADAEVETLLGRTTIDSLTGLATYDYVCARLGEIYSEPSRSERCFVIVDAPHRFESGPARLAHSLGLSNLLRSVFSSGETIAVLPHGLFVVLTTQNHTLDESLQRLGRSVRAFDVVENGAEGHVRVWTEALPDSQRLAEELLRERDAS
ncbi:MAG: hypothetical protein ACRCSP_09530 [Rhodoglobus sp.]